LCVLFRQQCLEKEALYKEACSEIDEAVEACIAAVSGCLVFSVCLYAVNTNCVESRTALD